MIFTGLSLPPDPSPTHDGNEESVDQGSLDSESLAKGAERQAIGDRGPIEKCREHPLEVLPNLQALLSPVED